MRKFFLPLFAFASVLFLSSFLTDKKELLGTWRWVHVQNTSSGEIMDVGMLTMNMSKDVKTELKDDGSFIEHKVSAEDGSVSKNDGEWTLEENGTVIKMKMNEKWRSSKILKLTADTLLVEIRSPMNLLMVREK